MDHDAATIVFFLEKEILERGFVFKTMLTNNGVEWQGEFKTICEKNGI